MVRAAVELWNERGFDDGVEETTVEEIAALAGVTKGTFYFHFAHKEDILLELGWGTAEALYEEAVHSVAGRRSGLAVVRQLLNSLARRVESVPPAAVVRSVQGFYSSFPPGATPGRRDLHQGLSVALETARLQGELPVSTDTDELGRVLSALAMDALLRWAQGDRRRLRQVLQSRSEIVLAGIRTTASGSPPVGGGPGPARAVSGRAASGRAAGAAGAARPAKRAAARKSPSR